jgi:hypothetical protein
MNMLNPGRLNYAPLQKAIYQMQPLPEILGGTSRWFEGYRIADYVGVPELGEADPKWKRPEPIFSEELFEEQGGFLYRFKGSAEFDVAVFATFFVVEINPGQDRTEFLVIAPIPEQEQSEELPYSAFLKGQNTATIQQDLRDSFHQSSFNEEVTQLVKQLRQAIPDARNGFFSKLFNRHKS